MDTSPSSSPSSSSSSSDVEEVTDPFVSLLRNADNGDAEAQAQLDQRFAALVARAELGDPDAQCEVGKLLFHGSGVPADETRALAYFRAASQQGHATAMTHLGYALRYGHGCQRNEAEAISLWERAAAMGDASAIRYAAQYYREPAHADVVQAVRWLTLAQPVELAHFVALRERARVLVPLCHQAAEQRAALVELYQLGRAATIFPRFMTGTLHHTTSHWSTGPHTLTLSATDTMPAQYVFGESNLRARRAALCWLWAGLVPAPVAQLIARAVWALRWNPALWGVLPEQCV